MTVGNGADTISAALRRIPRSLVEVEVCAVHLADAEGGVLAQLVYHRVEPTPGARTTLVAVHHGARELPPPATYERVRPEAALLDPSEIGPSGAGAQFPRGRGLRWVTPADPAGRAWPTGVRLVGLVDDAAAARLLADHFGVPLHREGPTA